MLDERRKAAPNRSLSSWLSARTTLRRYGVSTNTVIASAAKQSRIFSRRLSGLARCARNDGVRATVSLVQLALQNATTIPTQFGKLAASATLFDLFECLDVDRTVLGFSAAHTVSMRSSSTGSNLPTSLIAGRRPPRGRLARPRGNPHASPRSRPRIGCSDRPETRERTALVRPDTWPPGACARIHRQTPCLTGRKPATASQTACASLGPLRTCRRASPCS
jgi:hypothetical protein